MTAISSGETRDTILGGHLALIQPKHGYRFSVEAILLGRFVRPRRSERVLELGAGCGVISIMLASIYRPREVVAIEIQPDLAEMIGRNAALNDLESVRAICADLRHKKIARGESSATLADFVAAARRYARHGAVVSFVFTARRAAELISTMRAKKLEPKRIRFVHPRIAMPASVMIVEARVGGGIEASIEPPLILYDRPGIYTSEARAIL